MEPPTKLDGWALYRQMGSPKHIVAPMVDASELAWRVFSRSPVESCNQPAAQLAYTPMIHARLFSEMDQDNVKARGMFNLVCGEEGSFDSLANVGVSDRPLIAQFCANDPSSLLEAALKIQHRVDAVDLNLGCPQGIAKKGRYGSFLMEDWPLIATLVRTLSEGLDVPVTVKFRVYESEEKTVEYARMLEDAGAQVLCCHGRLREMKGQLTGLADWSKIKAVKQAVKVPVFANGNILYRSDIARCLAETGVEGVMSAEGNLFNPAIFLPEGMSEFQPVTQLAKRYLSIVLSLETRTASSAVKSHLFKLLSPALEREENKFMRDRMWVGVKISRTGDAWGEGKDWVRDWLEMMEEFEGRLQVQAWEALEEGEEGWEVGEVERKGRFPPFPKEYPTDERTGIRRVPFWLSQPHTRPLPPTTSPADPTASTSSTLAATVDPTGQTSTSTDEALATLPALATTVCSAAGSTVKCNNMPSAVCPHRACLLHCRLEGARKAGLHPLSDTRPASPSPSSISTSTPAPGSSTEQAGGMKGPAKGYASEQDLYVGLGCPSHEAKVLARQAAQKEKNARRKEAREKHAVVMAGSRGKKEKGSKRKKDVESEGEREGEEKGGRQKVGERKVEEVEEEETVAEGGDP